MQKIMDDLYDVIINNKETISNFKLDRKKYYTNDNGELVVFISIDNGYTRSYVVMGKGKNLKDAVEKAVNDYKNNTNVNFKPVSVKLDVVTKVLPILKGNSRINIRRDEVKYRRGEDGLLLSEDFSAAFLPEEVEAYKMIQKRLIQPEKVFDAFEKHFLLDDQKIVKKFLTAQFMDLYKFRTDSWYIDENGYLPLFRGHRIYNDLSEKNLLDAIELTKDNYFKQSVNPKGKFAYIYNPEDSTVPSKYNILRHAGTTYSMLETYELMPDEGLMRAIERAIKYLMTKVENTEINGKKAQVIVEKDAAKLGGNGLAIVALAKYTQLTGDEQYIPLMQNMATWMGELQDDSGKFAIHKQIFSTGEDSGFVSHYYPGEAILALCRLYQIDKNEKWLDLAENEANYLINVRDVNEDLDSIAHDHWLLYALNDLYRERPKEMYLKHSFFICEAILKIHRLDPNKYNQEWLGSFGSHEKAPSTPTACRSEGLGAAYRLAQDHNHTKEAEQYKNAMREAIKFQLQMHLKPESVMYYRNKKFCLGAVHQGLTNYELRNDYTQHNISSFISYYNILTKY
ncbi:beta-L-arabinofuranosidase domain-containing protein [Virgibacillus oceani]